MWPWPQPHTSAASSSPYQPPSLPPHHLVSMQQQFSAPAHLPYLAPGYPAHHFPHPLTDYPPSVGYTTPSMPQAVHVHGPAMWPETPLPSGQITTPGGNYPPTDFQTEDVHQPTLHLHSPRLQPAHTSPLVQHRATHMPSLPHSRPSQATTTIAGGMHPPTAFTHPQVASSPFSVAYLLSERQSGPVEMGQSYSLEREEEDIPGDNVSPTFPPPESPEDIRPLDSAFPQTAPAHMVGFQPLEGSRLGGNPEPFAPDGLPDPPSGFPEELPLCRHQSEPGSPNGDKLTISLPPEQPFSPPELIPDTSHVQLDSPESMEEDDQHTPEERSHDLSQDNGEESRDLSCDPEAAKEVSPVTEGEDSSATADVTQPRADQVHIVVSQEDEGIPPKDPSDQSDQSSPEPEDSDKQPNAAAEQEQNESSQSPTHPQPQEVIPKRHQDRPATSFLAPPPLVRTHLEYTSEDDDVFLPNSPSAPPPEPVAKQPVEEKGKSPAVPVSEGDCFALWS